MERVVAFAADHPDNEWILGCQIIPVSYTHLDVYKRQEYKGLTPELAAQRLAEEAAEAEEN